MSDNTFIAAEVIAAFVSHNSVPASDLPPLIRSVVVAFDILDKDPVEEDSTIAPVPAVPIRKSVHHDYIVSLETGQRFQTLVRHLSGLGMSPGDYRTKWALAADYPMTAKGYSERRSALAKSLGLGRKPVDAPAKVHKPDSKAKAPVEAELATATLGSNQEPAEAVQEAA